MTIHRTLRTPPRSSTRLLALLGALSLGCVNIGILPDDPARIRDAIENAAASHDLVVTSGGVSVGEEDHVRSAVAARAGDFNFV